MDYYFNDVPGIGKCRNNLIYTSLFDGSTFVQWYYRDPNYTNEPFDEEVLIQKWERELYFVQLLLDIMPQHLPELKFIDEKKRQIGWKVEDVDFWQQNNCCLPFTTLPDWQDQMLEIIKDYYDSKIWKFSVHPSSYFVVNGKLKVINQFFCYGFNEKEKSVAEHLSHISNNRLSYLKPHMEALGIDMYTPVPLEKLNHLCWLSFSSNYPRDFIERVMNVYNITV